MKTLLILILLFSFNAEAKQQRSYHAIKQFKLDNPCPANGRYKGSCEGFIIDHITPIACGGLDTPKNMQWQSVEDAKAKDRWERRAC
ncbi:MAG TPA: HNH endonuclease signature motif containing protein [Methylotenera sp.]|nr:HNH endonuclease signature motif containing protein [Methylotenera sp.]